MLKFSAEKIFNQKIGNKCDKKCGIKKIVAKNKVI